MKFIKNSIDSEYLQCSISDADLEKQMANCEFKSKDLNGQANLVNGRQVSDKMNTEGVELNKLSNGNLEKSPSKCNGKVNGFYNVEDEEDFNLVLEDSSECGESSPAKKIEEDTISAPQIVQEIEDLLGITSGSAGIQEELNNLDGTESMEDNLDHVDDIEDSQDSQEVIEEIEVEERKRITSEQVESTEEIKTQPDKTTETIECDTSSNTNLVFDEVEVRIENRNEISPKESNSIKKSDDTEDKVESTTEANTENLKDSVVSKTKDIKSRKDNPPVENCENDLVVSTSDEIPMTQCSSVSGNSEEWMVLDATETSDEEKVSGSQESTLTKNSIFNCDKSVDDLSLAKVPGSKKIDETKNISNYSLVIENDSASVKKLPITKSSDSETLKSDTNLECPVLDETTKLTKPEDSLGKTSNTSNPCEGEGLRKRSASGDDEEGQLKKPKLEDQQRLMESDSAVLKRSSPVPTENVCKRPKVSETTGVSEIPEEEKCQENKKADSRIDDEVNCVVVIEDESDQNTDIADVPITGTLDKIPQSGFEEIPGKNLVTDKVGESTPGGNNNISKLPTSSQRSRSPEKSISDDVVQGDEHGGTKDPISSEGCRSLLEGSNITSKEKKHFLISTSQTPNSKDVLPDSVRLSCEELKNSSEDKSQICGQKSASDENKENINSSSNDIPKEEAGCKSDDPSTAIKKESKLDETKKSSVSTVKAQNTVDLPKKTSFTKEISSSIKELEKSLIKTNQSSRDVKNTKGKKITNLDLAIERVAKNEGLSIDKKVPILRKFHKDQLRKLKRSELEDIVVSKICEAITYKSEIGQMRLRTQNLEDTNEIWRKKVQQIEKQNNELEMVLKRFLNDLAAIKRENQNKVPMPIKVTRSVGLQVVLASSMHGALVSSRSKTNSEATQQPPQQQQQQVVRVKPPEKEKIKEPVKASTFMPPIMRGRGRPPKPPSSRPTTPQTLSPKVSPSTTPSKPANTTPVKTIQTPTKDLEVIDLTDKEERAKSTSQPPAGGSIRVSPSTQVCFVQQSTASTPPQQPLYLVQKAGQRPQFMVATSTASPQRPISNVSRPPPALALPVFRAGGHLIPVTTAPQVGVKTNNTSAAVARQHPSSTMRIQAQPQTQVLKHPAPLPPTPISSSNPNWKNPPPKPQLKIAKTSNGIMLSWSMSLTKDMADMQSYQLFAYQEGNQPPSTGLWKKVGDVKALPLPMACTLTQFIEGHRYHFSVRAVDVHNRIGPFSIPGSIVLNK